MRREPNLFANVNPPAGDCDPIMEFGKYKGQRMSAIPVDYLDYLLGWDGLREHTREKITEHLRTMRAAEWEALGRDDED